VLAPRYFNGRKMTIYGGSSEVQRGIMSKVMLGLSHGSRLQRGGARLPEGSAGLDHGEHAAEVAEESRRSRTSHVSKERLLQWQKKLASRGWLCPSWPKEHGGPGWNATQKFIFEMEMARADSPYLSSFSIRW